MGFWYFLHLGGLLENVSYSFSLKRKQYCKSFYDQIIIKLNKFKYI